jgi:hypothetical protein
MHVQYVALCEHVILANDGRPSLIGVFNDLTVQTLPFTMPRLAFAARLHFTVDELDATRRIEVVITDPHGTEMGRPGGEITLPPAPVDADSIAVDLPLHFDLFQVPQDGRYTFVLHVDGKAVAGTQLNVRRAALA